MKNYNPYDLVSIKLNNHNTYGRPVEFSSQIVDQKKLTDAFGKVVKPTKISTTCADCGQGFTLDVDLGEPPFTVLAINCPVCRPAVIVPKDPFVDPVEIGLVQEHHINPSVADVEKEFEKVESSVADRLPVEVLEQVRDTEPEQLDPVPQPKPKPAKKEKVSKPKAEKPKSSKPEKAKKESTPAETSSDDFVDYGKKRDLPKAEEMTPEVDLDSLED